MQTIKEIQEQIIEEFAVFSDWMEKYEYLIDLGKSLEPLDEKARTESNLIKGCQSRVWLDARVEDGRLFFQADSDAIITKGIVSLLIRVFSGRTPREILDADMSFITTIGLKDHLSPTRSNGLLAMIQQIHLYAVAAEKV